MPSIFIVFKRLVIDEKKIHIQSQITKQEELDLQMQQINHKRRKLHEFENNTTMIAAGQSMMLRYVTKNCRI